MSHLLKLYEFMLSSGYEQYHNKRLVTPACIKMFDIGFFYLMGDVIARSMF